MTDANSNDARALAPGDWVRPRDTTVCPYCGEGGCSAEWVDVGVGMVQAGPFHCEACGAFELGPYDDMTPTDEERRVGWYSPTRTELPTTVSTLDGRFLDSQTALGIYRQGLVEQVPFHAKSADLVKSMRIAASPDVAVIPGRATVQPLHFERFFVPALN